MQKDLFDASEYPRGVFKPLHPSFKGKAEVPQFAFDPTSEPFTVNLTTGECSCKHGAAFTWYSDKKVIGKWINNRYCVHKLKAIADIMDGVDIDKHPDQFFAFVKAVATRYNQYEVVSAFHKYLRLGKVDRAYFFACILCTTRSAKGIIKYLSNILYEETRDHALMGHLTGLLETPDKITFLDMAKAITWFCETPKKWDLHETRIPLFYHEMRGYQRLAKEFGFDVAKAQEIIDEDMVPVFLGNIPKAIYDKDWDFLQYCVKGIQKSKFPDGIKDLHHLRLAMFTALYGAAKVTIKSPLRKKQLRTFATYIKNKPASVGLSYHDLNAFADFIAGEPYRYGELRRERVTQILAIKKLPLFPFDKFPPIPLFAHDNHTWRGKALLRTHAGQIPFGIEQTGFDLRGCGAYHGVSWRYHAAAQGGIRQPWEDVKAPKWVADFTLNMFY